MREFLRKLSWLFRRRTREQDLEAELRFHLEETAEAAFGGALGVFFAIGGIRFLAHTLETDGAAFPIDPQLNWRA
jgi:hypothetical protein